MAVKYAATLALLSAHQGSAVSMPTLWWNSHYQCSEGISGKCSSSATPGCSQKAKEAFVDLVKTAEAKVAAAIELFPSAEDTQPYDFTEAGLDGFTQVSDGYCDKGAYPDQIALLFAPGWAVEKSGGGCLGGGDSRAFAAARVTPPEPVSGCADGLCVVAVHMPHAVPSEGTDIVQSVCSGLTQACTVTFGDWNAPDGGSLTVEGDWAALIGSSPPSYVGPTDVNTCCYECGGGNFDHLATNVAGAVSATPTVFDYQILEENPVEQHNPVLVPLVLPSSTADDTNNADNETRRLDVLV